MKFGSYLISAALAVSGTAVSNAAQSAQTAAYQSPYLISEYGEGMIVKMEPHYLDGWEEFIPEDPEQEEASENHDSSSQEDAASTPEEEKTDNAQAPAQQTAAPAAASVSEPVSNAYQHGINTGVISAPNTSYPNAFAQAMAAGQSVFNYTDINSTLAALSDAWYNYAGIAENCQYYESSTDQGPCIVITDQSMAVFQNAVANRADPSGNYRAQVAALLSSINLYGSDAQIVDRINSLISARSNYVITNDPGMSGFINSGSGQCYHYAHLFTDMCNAAGIPASYAEGNNHAWSYVTVNGRTYMFDPTNCDVTGDLGTYSWVAV